MYNKRVFFTAAALLVSTIVLILIQASGISLKGVTAGIVVVTLYGIFVVSYLLRFAFIFIGVFALFRMLQIRHYKQIAG